MSIAQNAVMTKDVAEGKGLIKFQTYFKEEKKEKLKLLLLRDFKNRKKLRKIDVNGTVKKVSRVELMMNIILQKLYKEFDLEDYENHWFSSKKVNDIYKFFDDALENYEDFYDNIEKTNFVISEIIEEVSELSLKINEFTGITFSLYEFIQQMKEFPRLREILLSKFTNTKNYQKVSKDLKDRTKELTNILTENSKLYNLILSASNAKQYQQLFVGIGAKPDIFGNIIPHIPNTNFLMGIESLDDMLTLAKATRKILIITHRSVKSSGYLMRRLSLLAIDVLLDPKSELCKSKYLLEIEIKDQNTLNRFRNRWYHEDSDGDDDLKMIDIYDQDLIGRVLYFKSPITCADEKICKFCYGDLYKVNQKLHIGLLAVLLLTAQLTQNLLSAKHLIEANAEILEWSESMLNNFIIDADILTVDDSTNETVLVINDDDIREDEEMKATCIDKLYMIQNDEREESEIEIPCPLYISKEVLYDILNEEFRRDMKYYIPLKRFSDQGIFYTFTKNEEMTSGLNEIKDAIEKRENPNQSYSELVQYIIGLMNENGIHLDSVHLEVILRNIVRDGETPRLLPDWASDEVCYELAKLKTAIQANKLASTLSYEKLKEAFTNIDIFLKDGESILDVFIK